MTDSKPNRLAYLASLSGTTAETEHATLAQDTLSRARWARAHNDGHPNGAWSTGEQLIVAWVLDDTEHMAAMGYTPDEAAQRVAGGMFFPPDDIEAWLADLRIQLAA